MKKQEMVDLALTMGFANAALVETAKIPFQPAFRACCEDNSCGKYGINWSCPPDCGSEAEMQEKIQRYPLALLVESTWDIDSQDAPAIKKCKGQHNHWLRGLIEKLEGETRGFMVGASGCSLCETCAIVDGQPCRFPDKMASCMSAYCIYVQKLAEENGLEYDSGPGLVNFFGMYVFAEK